MLRYMLLTLSAIGLACIGFGLENAGPAAARADRPPDREYPKPYDQDSGEVDLRDFPSCATCMPITDAYGIGIDNDGNIWISQHGANTVTKISPDGQRSGPFDTGGDNCDRGVAITPLDNDVWIVSSDEGQYEDEDDVTRLRNDGTYCELLTVGNFPTGVAVDAAGNVWVINWNLGITAHQDRSTVMKIQPGLECGSTPDDPIATIDLDNVNGETHPLGHAEPYTMGDLTGMVTLQTTATATWTVIHDGEVYGAGWSRVIWNTDDCTAPDPSIPEGTAVRVSVRAADTVMNLPMVDYIEVGNDVPFTDVRGRYIQVRVWLQGACPSAGEFITPVLCDLEIVGDPGLTVDCNTNGLPDECDADCNLNGIPDDCEVPPIDPSGNDCNGNGVPDECEIDKGSTAGGGPFYCTAFCDPDCNDNGTPDSCDIDSGFSLDCPDCTGNGIPDECEPDCNDNDAADSCDICCQTSEDCNGNGIPDECEGLPTGACCSGYLTCWENQTEACCSLDGGIFLGSESDCGGSPCDEGACCATNGTCTQTVDGQCSGTFLGYGLGCEPNCCLQPPSGGDDCCAAEIIEVPDFSQGSVTINISGDNSMATGPDCPDLAPDPVWWEAFNIDAWAAVTLDFCCMNPSFSPAYTLLYDRCPCAGGIRPDEFGPMSGCAYGSVSGTWRALPPGTYYYPIYADQDGTLGPYQIHLTVDARREAACCLPPDENCEYPDDDQPPAEGCVVTTEADCSARGGWFLNDTPICSPGATCSQGACCTSSPACYDDWICDDCHNLLNGDYVGAALCEYDPCAEALCEIAADENCKACNGSFFYTSDAAACLRVADDFSLPDDGFVGQLCWRGIYHDFGQSVSLVAHAHNIYEPSRIVDCSQAYLGDDYPESATDQFSDDFIITVWDDAGGWPDEAGSPVFSSPVTATGQQVGELGAVPVFEYAADFSVNLNEEDCYWIEIKNTGAGMESCYWLWEASTEVHNAASLQDADAEWQSDDTQLRHDMSLCLDQAMAQEDCALDPPCPIPGPPRAEPYTCEVDVDCRSGSSGAQCVNGLCVCTEDGDCINEACCIGGYCYAPKNRYVSFYPPDFDGAMALRVTSPDYPGWEKWVKSGPCDGSLCNLAGPEECRGLQCTPMYAVWDPDTMIHLGDVDIVPGNGQTAAWYSIEAIAEECNPEAPCVFSEALSLPTVTTWGDTCASPVGSGYSPPDGIVGLDDVQAAIAEYEDEPHAPPMVWVDLMLDCPDGTVGLQDIMAIIDAFQGGAYPYDGPEYCDP